jgi:hypothetical protein
VNPCVPGKNAKTLTLYRNMRTTGTRKKTASQRTGSDSRPVVTRPV